MSKEVSNRRTSKRPKNGGRISRALFGVTGDGKRVCLYTLRNARGMEARICNYGGIVVSLKVPDRDGRLDDVVLGFERLGDYLKPNPYLGGVIGRYANRIANARFALDGKTHRLAANSGPNTLHGGLKGFDRVLWRARPVPDPRGPSLELTRVSPDGEEGYPGTLQVKAVYTLTRDNSLRLELTAMTDRPTIVNLTQHSYFNLAGRGDILGHGLFIDAAEFTPVDRTLIPTGEIQPVAGTPFDFRAPEAIGLRIRRKDGQLKFGRGFDHNWVIRGGGGRLRLHARVTEPATGRALEVFSNQPGLQFYSGNFLDGKLQGKGGESIGFRTGFCLEPQNFPNSPNQPCFPSAVLKPGQVYRHTMIQRFSVTPPLKASGTGKKGRSVRDRPPTHKIRKRPATARM